VAESNRHRLTSQGYRDDPDILAAVTATVLARLLGIVAVVAIGYLAARTGVLGGDDAAPVLSNLAFTVFTPALLFRTTALVDLATLPWVTLAAYFGPALVVLLAGYLIARGLRQDGDPPGLPAVRAIAVTFGNTVQVGLPVVLALYGQQGLRLHVAIVSLHALTILTVITALIEVDLARDARARDGGAARLARTVLATARNTVIHPVVLPVLAGLAWNLARLPLPGPVDDVLQLLGQAVVPVCLVLIGVSLHRYGSRTSLGPALALAAAKLLVLPAAVLVTGHWLLGVQGLPLRIAVLCAAAPVGSNVLLFAQRYRTGEGEASTAIVLSTPVYALTLPLWLAVLAQFP
jgi:malonate transporter and related proteins